MINIIIMLAKKTLFCVVFNFSFFITDHNKKNITKKQRIRYYGFIDVVFGLF